MQTVQMSQVVLQFLTNFCIMEDDYMYEETVSLGLVCL